MRPDGRAGARKPSALAIALIAGGAVLCAAWAVAAATLDGPIGSALRSGRLIALGAIAGGCALVVALLAAVMVRLGHAGRRSARETRQAGTASIEFIMVFVVILPLVLVMIQAMLMAAGHVVVHYAAYCAARAAITWVPEKVSYEEPRNVVTAPGDPDSPSDKMARLHAAAVEAVKAVCPSDEASGTAPVDPGGLLVADGLDRFYSQSGEPVPGWVHRMVPAKYNYASEYTKVTMDPPADGETYGDREDLRVRVEHTLFLVVPVAGKALTYGSDDHVEMSNGGHGTRVEATYTLTNQGEEDEIDVEVFPRYVGRGEE